MEEEKMSEQPQQIIQPDILGVQTQQLPEEQIKYAGFWVRFLAVLIDVIILAIIGRLFFGSEVTGISTVGDTQSFYVHYNGWKIIIPIVYVIGFWIWIAATPGKFICRLKIVDYDDVDISIKKSFIRAISYVISFVPLLFGFFWIGFDQKKQTWHDKIAKTYVIKK